MHQVIPSLIFTVSDVEFVGMSLSYGLSLNSLVYFAISISCMLENDMVSVERVNQYSALPSEAAWAVSDCLPSANWLQRGDIDIKDLEVSFFFFVDSSFSKCFLSLLFSR